MSSVALSRVRTSRSARMPSAVAVSRCSPGSSRMRTGKSASSERATARRWRWPPDILAPRSPSSVSRPAGRLSPSRAGERPTGPRESHPRWPRARPPGGSPRPWCRRCGRPARRGRPRACSPRRSGPRCPCRQASRRPAHSPESAAARPRAWTCRRRWDPPPQPCAAARGRGRSPPAQAGPLRDSGSRARLPAGGRGRAGSSAEWAGSDTGGETSITPNTRAAERRTRWRVCVAVGSGPTSSNATSGISARPASSTPLILPECTAVTPTSRRPTWPRPSRVVSGPGPVPRCGRWRQPPP